MIEPLFHGRAIVAFARRRSGGGRAPEVFQGVDVLADDSWLFMSGTASADGIATAPPCPDSESRGSPFAVSRKPGSNQEHDVPTPAACFSLPLVWNG